MLNIRAAQPKDVNLLLGLFRELAEFEKLLEQVQVDEKRLTSSLFGPHKAADALIVEHDGQPIGYAVYFFNFSTFLGKPGLYLEDIYVRPTVRGRGIGSAIFKHLAGIALERGCERMEWVVLDWNVKAITFYENIGAKMLDDWRVFRLAKNEIASVAKGEHL
jgi:GNAT superfamily N-acetyltransferase